MVYCIEETLQIKVYTIVIAILCVFLYPLESIMGTTIRTKAETIVTELAFIDGNQDLAYRLLEEAVYHVGYTELTLLSIILGYLYPTNRTWSVFTRHDTG